MANSCADTLATAMIAIRHWIFMGNADGSLALQPRGAMRPKLPYDVIFIPAGFDRTFGEMTDAEKNRLSHRGAAFALLKDFLEKNITALKS